MTTPSVAPDLDALFHKLCVPYLRAVIDRQLEPMLGVEVALRNARIAFERAEHDLIKAKAHLMTLKEQVDSHEVPQ